MHKEKATNFLKLDHNANSDNDYLISSLYFDDIYDTALYDKNFGVLKRKKYRIRVYNRNDKVIKLELKSKFGQYINKESTGLTREEYNKILNYDIDF